MPEEKIPNLDYYAAQHAQAIVRRTKEKKTDDPLSCAQKATDVENLVTKTLGVLQENGVYACFLYLFSRTQKKEQAIAGVMVDEMLNILGTLRFNKWNKPAPNNAETVLAHIAEHIAKDIHRLLLAREALERTLIYARYGAKARK